MATAGSSQIRGILFDKDGTLVDFNRTWFGITMELAHKAADGDEARARALVEAGGYDWEMEKFRGGSVVAAGTIHDIVDLWHPELTLAEKRERIRAYDDYAVREGSRRAVGIEGLRETLEALVAQGFVLGIATNDSEAGARATAGALGLTALFSAIIGYDSVTRAKPHADQLHLFATRTGLKPDVIAMVGDNAHDLEMAHAAGAGLAIGVLSGNSTLDDLGPLSDAILGSIAELPQYLKSRA
ncbi:HAD family hydrolase [Phyllobacterium brassicacearum]|uniref:phosphoglycolate phosphatase n=1 Tax=Phyllobacterium brassicacearum TaxID=314235 RepID=A0A2P7BEJ3_9HYPH|nr:HAD family hydrolase [Phyllobacterium brassicacearum]PSH64858.1 HAD family hydrolase [Phyllobacterium brassicacearum]TDQ22995.1 phosphoglycolate phosphatase [Phyllobacterium brassicacearum]